MDDYRKRGHEELIGSEGTSSFLKRVNKINEIMTSREPKKALRPNSTDHQVSYMSNIVADQKIQPIHSYFINFVTCYSGFHQIFGKMAIGSTEKWLHFHV